MYALSKFNTASVLILQGILIGYVSGIEDDGNKFHKVLTNELIKEEVEEFNKFGNGAELFKYLIMVGRSDNLAQNPELTGESLQLLNTMEI